MWRRVWEIIKVVLFICSFLWLIYFFISHDADLPSSAKKSDPPQPKKPQSPDPLAHIKAALLQIPSTDTARTKCPTCKAKDPWRLLEHTEKVVRLRCTACGTSRSWKPLPPVKVTASIKEKLTRAQRERLYSQKSKK